jgi:hypothetical protein
MLASWLAQFIQTKMSVTEYLRWWLEAYGLVKLKPLTCDSYKMICERHLIPALGAIPGIRGTPYLIQVSPK